MPHASGKSELEVLRKFHAVGQPSEKIGLSTHLMVTKVNKEHFKDWKEEHLFYKKTLCKTPAALVRLPHKEPKAFQWTNTDWEAMLQKDIYLMMQAQPKVETSATARAAPKPSKDKTPEGRIVMKKKKVKKEIQKPISDVAFSAVNVGINPHPSNSATAAADCHLPGPSFACELSQSVFPEAVATKSEVPSPTLPVPSATRVPDLNTDSTRAQKMNPNTCKPQTTASSNNFCAQRDTHGQQVPDVKTCNEDGPLVDDVKKETRTKADSVSEIIDAVANSVLPESPLDTKPGDRGDAGKQATDTEADSGEVPVSGDAAKTDSLKRGTPKKKRDSIGLLPSPKASASVKISPTKVSPKVKAAKSPVPQCKGSTDEDKKKKAKLLRELDDTEGYIAMKWFHKSGNLYAERSRLSREERALQVCSYRTYNCKYII